MKIGIKNSSEAQVFKHTELRRKILHQNFKIEKKTPAILLHDVVDNSGSVLEREIYGNRCSSWENESRNPELTKLLFNVNQQPN